MGFGNQLFQLAQGIIANERQRKAQEARAEAQDIAVKQAERTFGFKEKELAAREKAIGVQQSQEARAKATALTPEEITERNQIKLDTLKAERDIKRAQLEKEKSPDKTTDTGLSATQRIAVLKAGQERHGQIKTDRTSVFISNVADETPQEDQGVDLVAVQGAQKARPFRTLEQLDGHITRIGKDIADLSSKPGTDRGILERQLESMKETQKRLHNARSELTKVQVTPVSKAEWDAHIRDESIDPETSELLFRSDLNPFARKMEIWGDTFDPATNMQLERAIKISQTGQMQPLANWMRLNPGTLLDQAGNFNNEASVRKFTEFLTGEGFTPTQVGSLMNLLVPRR